MCTTCLLPISPSMHCTGGGGWLVLGGVWSWEGTCLWSRGCLSLIQGGTCLWFQVGYLPLVLEGGVSQHAMGQTHPCEQNHRHV